MRKVYCWLLTAGLMGGVANLVSAQSNEGLFPRLRGLFSPKTKADDAKGKTDAPKETRVTSPAIKTTGSSAAPTESRGVIFIEEPNRSSTTILPPATPGTASASPARSMPAKTTSIQSPVSASGTVAAPSNAPVTPSTTPPPTTTAVAQKLTRQVTQACPQARNVRVAFTGGNEVTVEITARNVDECNALAAQIFTIRDLDPYRVNLKFQVQPQ